MKFKFIDYDNPSGTHNKIGFEIAYQLKRIADELEVMNREEIYT